MKRKFTLIKFKNKDHIFNYCKIMLSNSIQNKKKNIMFSGGSTFIEFYKKILKIKKIEKINFILSDERIVKDNNLLNSYNIKKNFFSKNKRLLKKNFFFDIKNYINASKKNLLQKLKRDYDSMKISIDLAFLGVGNDGHVASIFEKKNKKYPQNNLFCISKKRGEKFFRVSFKLNYIINLKKIIFVIYGKEKKHLVKNLTSSIFKDNIFSFILKKSKSNIIILYA